MMQINRKIATPLYQQVKQVIAKKIYEGEFKPGEKILSEAQFCKAFGISRICVRQAIAGLVHEGVLHAVPGKGVFVNGVMQDIQLEYIRSFKEKAAEKGYTPEIKLLEASTMQADKELAEHLKITEKEEILKIKRLKSVNGIPVNTELRYIPAKYCPGLIEKGLAQESLSEQLERYNLTVASRDIVLTPMLLDSDSANLLRSKEGNPCIFITEILYLDNGAPLKYEQRIHKNGVHFRSKTAINKTV
jgi:GntR family transcriptional regulator